MRFVLDIGILLILGIFAYLGAKKGFIKSCGDFLGAFAAMIMACVFSKTAAEWIFGTFFREALTEKIAAAVTGMKTADAVSSVFRDFPEVIQRGLLAAGITEGSVMVQLQNGTVDAAEGITEAISPLMIDFIRILALVVLFILLMVVIRALINLLSGLFKLPLLNGINKLLGGVFGILMAVVAVWVVFACIKAYMPMLSAEMQERIVGAQEHSALLRSFFEINPAFTLIE